ncbi:MAG: CoA-binding protein [Opitutaceae bacterium]|jgi:hypothetical protein
MLTHAQAVSEFLAGKVIAIVGVSHNPRKGVGCFLLRKFRDAGYRAHPVNPSAKEIEGVACFPNLKAIPETIDGILLVTNPKDSLGVVKECAELGVKRVWFHRSLGQGSYSKEAEEFCRQNGIGAITIGCPAMYLNADIAHRCFKFFLSMAGKLKMSV